MFIEEKSCGEARVNGGTELQAWQEVLLDAADSIRQYGLCKHAFVDAKGAQCALGAIHKASLVGYGTIFGRDRNYLACHQADAIFSGYIHDLYGYNVATWNDDPIRTGEEVAAALEACARGSS